MGRLDAVPAGPMAPTPGRPGTRCLTSRRPHGLQVTRAIGRRSPIQGWALDVFGGALPVGLEERAPWRCVLSLRRTYARLQVWRAPELRHVPGTDAVSVRRWRRWRRRRRCEPRRPVP